VNPETTVPWNRRSLQRKESVYGRRDRFLAFPSVVVTGQEKPRLKLRAVRIHPNARGLLPVPSEGGVETEVKKKGQQKSFER